MTELAAGRRGGGAAPAARWAGGAMTPVATALGAHPFFVDLSDAVVAMVAELTVPVDLERGQVLGREGQPARRFYALRSGRVALQVHRAGRPGAALRTLRAGDVVGWSWLVPPYHWHFDAVATEPVEALAVDGARLRAEMDADPVLGYALTSRFLPVIVDRLQAVAGFERAGAEAHRAPSPATAGGTR